MSTPVKSACCAPSIQSVRPPLFAPAAVAARQSISTECGASLMVNQPVNVQVLPSFRREARI